MSQSKANTSKRLWVCMADESDDPQHLTEYYEGSEFSGCEIHPIAGGCTISETALQPYIQQQVTKGKIIENEQFLKLWGKVLEQLKEDVGGKETITQQCAENNLKVHTKRIAELQQQLKRGE